MSEFDELGVDESRFVGDPCMWCDEELAEPSVSIVQPMHRECAFRAIQGGVNHQRETCTCHGGDDPPDPPHLTLREAALASFYYFLGREENPRS